MKAVLFPGDGEAELVELTTPVPGAGEVLIRLRRSGVCGTDVHYWHETPEERGPRRSVVPGHEVVGVVDAVGAGVEALHAGDRVVVGMLHIGCGRCRYCAAGLYSHCPDKEVVGRTLHGSYGEFVCVPERAVYRLPDLLSDEVAVLVACNLPTAYSALAKTDLRAGDRVAVLGLGAVGLCAVLVAASFGLAVIAVDPVVSRRARATELGAASVSDPAEFHTAATDENVDAVIECSGHRQAQADAIAALGPGGRVVVVGMGGQYSFTAGDLASKEAVLMGSAVCPADRYYEVLDFAVAHRSELETLLGPSFTIAEAVNALQHSASAADGKPVFAWTPRTSD